MNIGADGAGSVLRSVVAGEADDFFAVGTATDSQNNQKPMGMRVRVRTDRIFGHGMEQRTPTTDAGRPHPHWCASPHAARWFAFLRARTRIDGFVLFRMSNRK